MKEKAFRTQIRKIEIYLIHSPETGEVVIGKCRAPNTYQAYKDHVRLAKSWTEDFFRRVKERGIFPKMYLLERLETTETIAYGHVVAWTKYFLTAGYTVFSYKQTLSYAEYLTDQNQKVFEEISKIPLEEILAEDKIIVGKYIPMSQRQAAMDDGQKRISVVVSAEEYEIIKQRAEAQYTTISKYCKRNILDGAIVKIELVSFSEQLRQIKDQLDMIAENIYNTGKYVPGDIVQILDMMEEIRTIKQNVFEYLEKQFKEIWKRRKSR